MRPTLASLLRIRPFTVSELGEKAVASLRLPPTRAEGGSGGVVVAGASTPKQMSRRQRRQGKEVSLTERLLIENENQSQIEGGTGPANLRFEKHTSNKEKFWNIPKEKRETLKKLMRES